MVELFRYFIFVYCFLGIFIAGGLFFNKRTPANTMLALFILLFTLELLDYLYTTSQVIIQYPEYYLYIYPVCLLFGPSLWLHFKYVQHPNLGFKKEHLLHFIPFLLFIGIGLFPLLGLSGDERIAFTRANFMSYMMPLNYIRTGHVTLYGLAMIFVLLKDKLYEKNEKGIYLSLVGGIYFVTAVLQVYLTMFADNFRQFAIYFFLAATIFLIVGVVLYKYPEFLDQVQQKYFSSTLKEIDKQRIQNKIMLSTKDKQLFFDSSLKLSDYCKKINEKQNHVSQVFSTDIKTSFTHFVNCIRVQKAKDLLSDPAKDDLKILAVAYECGFNNTVTFNKAFVKETGTTPGKFRKDRKLIIAKK